MVEAAPGVVFREEDFLVVDFPEVLLAEVVQEVEEQEVVGNATLSGIKIDSNWIR